MTFPSASVQALLYTLPLWWPGMWPAALVWGVQRCSTGCFADSGLLARSGRIDRLRYMGNTAFMLSSLTSYSADSAVATRAPGNTCVTCGRSAMGSLAWVQHGRQDGATCLLAGTRPLVVIWAHYQCWSGRGCRVPMRRVECPSSPAPR